MTTSGRPARAASLAVWLLLASLVQACDGTTPTPAGTPAETEAPGATAAPDAPDLVLVVIDTLRADRLSCYGYERPTTPTLDALAQDGALFLDVTAQSSWTLPSMASMLSGRNLFVNAQRMPPGVPSLAERLADAGYETAAFVGNPAVSRRGDYHRGFDSFVTRDDTGQGTWDAARLERAVNDWLAENPFGAAPRFLYLHLLDPHWPYEPPPGTTLAGEARLRDDVLEVMTAEVRRQGEGTPIWEHFDRDRRSILRDLEAYDRELVSLDAMLGRLLPRLRRASRERLVVVASDHGEGLWDHRHFPELVERDLPPEERTLREVFFRDHSYHMYQELIRTPLIVSGAGIPPTAPVRTPVANVDIMPTLLRAAGLEDDAKLDGQALQDVVAGTAPERALLFSHSNEATVVRSTGDGWKLVFPTDTGFHFGMDIQLYELGRDPFERVNRGDEREGEVADLHGRLERARKSALASFHLYDDVDAGPDEAMLETLRELGYVGPGFGGDGR